MQRRARTLIVATALGSAVLLGACGGGESSGTSAPTTPPAPAAKVDPNSNGAVAGPINKARTAVSQLNQQQQQEQQQTGG
jgi:hypothetical protein